MRRFWLSLALTTVILAPGLRAAAEPVFVNGLVIPGNTLDATRQPGANAGRLGFFSDIYYDPNRDEWWAVSDRGPGGGVLDYATRVQRFTIDVHPVTGRISNFRVKETVKFTDPKGLLPAPISPVANRRALNGLNPSGLGGNVSVLGRSFDPEGLVIDPRTCHLMVADEYGPSVYEFSRAGHLLHVFQTPANLVPKVGATVNLVTDRDGGLTAGRQDNRGFESIAITPDGSRLYAVLQDPLINEPGPNNGRNGRNVRIVVFDNDWEGLAIGPRLRNGAHLILAGNDNDYSVTQQAGTNIQFDVYVDFQGDSVQRDLDQPTMLNGQVVGPPPPGHVLLPGVLHAYRASASDLSTYVKPGGRRGHDDCDDDDDRDYGRGHDDDDHDHRR